MMLVTIFLCALMALMAAGALATISLVGKPRQPVTQGTAVAVVLVQGLQIAGLVYVLLHR
jgi:hypothetical protein